MIVYCDFHVLDDLCVDVVLSNNYIFDKDIFLKCSEFVSEYDLGDKLVRLCNICLIGQFELARGGPKDDEQPFSLGDLSRIWTYDYKNSGFTELILTGNGLKRAGKERSDLRLDLCPA
jgi:hypothetical protein